MDWPLRTSAASDTSPLCRPSPRTRTSCTTTTGAELQNHVACMMADHAESGALSVRFEDVVTRPMKTCDTLYRVLGVRWSEDEKFNFKAKPHGAERLADVGVS